MMSSMLSFGLFSHQINQSDASTSFPTFALNPAPEVGASRTRRCLFALLIIASISVYILKGIWDVFEVNKPRGIPTVGAPTFIGKWLYGLQFNWRAKDLPRLMQQHPNQEPLAIPTVRGYEVWIQEAKQIEDYDLAPINQVSAKSHVDELIPREAVWGGVAAGFLESNKHMVQNIIKHRLKLRLSYLFDQLDQLAQHQMETHLLNTSEMGKGEWRTVKGLTAFSNILTPLNTITIIGSELGTRKDFLDAYLAHRTDVILTCEVGRFLPLALLHPLARAWVGLRGNLHRLSALVGEYVERRIPEVRNSRDDLVRDDLVSAVISMSKGASTAQIISQAVSLLFGASQQPQLMLCFVLCYLCRHPQYQAPLREEATRFRDVPYSDSNNFMPLLDSFMRETARLEPIAIVPLQHKVDSDFTFSDGTVVPKGNKIGIAATIVQRNEEVYSMSNEFQPFRFVSESELGDSGKTPTERFSASNINFPFWGQPRRSCPGRFYTSMICKLVMTRLLLDYDFRLVERRGQPNFNWHTVSILHPSTQFEFRERQR